MGRAEFAALKAGDVIVFNGKRLRTVQEGPADKPRRCRCDTVACGHMYVTFAIARRSWRNRAQTLYTWNDLKRKVQVTGKRTGLLMLKSELLTLRVIGFDVRKELGRELAEAERVANLPSLKRPLCRAYDRLKRLVP